jgi:DNA-binding MarR family transcriptional regulator
MNSSLQALLCETRRAALALAEAADENLAPMGITSRERALLDVLAREKQPITSLALARKQLVSLEAVEDTVSRLCLRGWVMREENDCRMSRASACQLTRSGRAFLDTVRAAETRLSQRLETELGEQMIGATVKALRRLRRSVPRPQITGLLWSGR